MITLTSNIEYVTVYTDRAQIFRVASLKPGKGTFEFLFDDLPNAIDPGNVQVRGKGGYSILNIQVLTVEKTADVPKEIFTLKEELQKLAEEEKITRHKLLRFSEEIDFIKGIQTKLTSGSLNDQDFNPDSWKKMMSLHRIQFDELDKAVYETEKKLNDLQTKQKDILKSLADNGIDASTNYLGKKTFVKQIKLLAEVNTDEEIKLSLSYLLGNASWRPQYDLRIDSEESMLNISYLGIIQQNTGEDWNNVQIQLSTARPAVQGTPPVLYAWHLYKRENEDYDMMPAMKSSMPKGGGESLAMLDKMMEEATIPMATARSGASSVVFDITGTVTVKNGEANIRTTILLKPLTCQFNYRIFPAASPYAFLSVLFKNDTDFPFLEGPANIFTDGNFTSKTNLGQIIPGEETDLSLGIDEGIIVKHLHLKTYEKKEGVFQKRKKLIDESKTTIHNTKKGTFTFTVKEAVPLSMNQDIHVELLQPGAKETYEHSRDEEGILTRKVILKGGEKAELYLTFSIDYPQSIDVDGLPC